MQPVRSAWRAVWHFCDPTHGLKIQVPTGFQGTIARAPARSSYIFQKPSPRDLAEAQ
jgi:hypothetical protein